MFGVAGQFFSERPGRRTGEFRRRRLDNGENQFFVVEGVFELVVALAPIQLRRNQLVDVGVDGEIAGGIEARPDREHQRENDDESGKTRTGSNNRDDNIGQHIVSF